MMKSIRRSVCKMAVAVLIVAGGGTQSTTVRACSQTQPLIPYGGYVDAYDQAQNIFLVFWGYGTYGDPLSFESAANAIFDATTDLPAGAGIGATRFYNVTAQYAGLDWNSGAYSQIAPTPGAYFVTDEGGLPAPDPISGKIVITDDDIATEADYIAGNFATTYDDVVVVFTPPNAPPPDSSLCGRHIVSPNYTITAWVTYPGQPGCSFSREEQVLTHEIAEAVTDPGYYVGASYEGWDQGTDATCEIGDICEDLSFSIQTQDASFSPSIVTTQPELSNEAVAAGHNGCVYGRSTKAYVLGLYSLISTSLHSETVFADTSVTFPSSYNWGTPSGVTLTGGPAAVSWGEGHIDAFVRGTDGHMYHATTNDEGFSVAWEQLTSPSGFTQSPDAVSWGAGNVQVFAVQGNNIVKNAKDGFGAWSGWTNVTRPSGVNPVSKVTVAAWGATNTSGGFPTDVHTVLASFRGSDGKVWIGNSVAGGGFSWRSFSPPATLTGDPDLSAWAPSPRFDLFVLDNSGNLWDMYSTDGKNVAGSSNFGHPGGSAFRIGAGVAAMGDGRLLLGALTGTSTPYVQLWNWAAGTWVTTGFSFTSAIDIASP